MYVKCEMYVKSNKYTHNKSTYLTKDLLTSIGYTHELCPQLKLTNYTK